MLRLHHSHLLGSRKKGVALLEILIALVVFSIATLVFYRVYQVAVLQIIETKYRTAAIALANERMEHVRSIPYMDIGVSGSSVSGSLLRDEVAVVNGLEFRILTTVFYIDDVADGTLAASTDANFEDYKRVKVYVLWGEGTDQDAVSYVDGVSPTYQKRRIDLVSTFIPPGGLEGVATGGGVSLNVLHSDGLPVPGVTAQITCASCGVDEVAVTDSLGNHLFIVPPSSTGTPTQNNYVMCVSKAGYEKACSQIPYDGSVVPAAGSYNPQNEHLTVLVGQMSTVTFIIDPVSDFSVAVTDPFCQDIGSGPYTLEMTGGRLVGSTVGSSSENIYSLSSFFGNTTITTDAGGEVTIYTDTNADGSIDSSDDAASRGRYEVDREAFEVAHPGLLFWKIVPSSDEESVTFVNEDTYACNFIVLDRSVNGLFVRAVDDSDPDNVIYLEGVTVHAHEPFSGYAATRVTDKHGYVYFPKAYNVPLVAGDYEVSVTMEGYDSYTDTVTVSVGLEEVDVSMTPSP